jgi:hypothetical protein
MITIIIFDCDADYTDFYSHVNHVQAKKKVEGESLSAGFPAIIDPLHHPVILTNNPFFN